MLTANFQMFKLDLEKAEEPEIKLPEIKLICWIIEKAREFQKNIYFCFIDYAKAFDCEEHSFPTRRSSDLTSLNIRKFTVHVLSKPGLEKFEHYLTSV